MQAFGAFAPTMDGLKGFVDIAINQNDEERPRWRLNGKFWSTKPEQMEMVKETQKLLIELGPTLVEMKLLEQYVKVTGARRSKSAGFRPPALL